MEKPTQKWTWFAKSVSFLRRECRIILHLTTFLSDSHTFRMKHSIPAHNHVLAAEDRARFTESTKKRANMRLNFFI